MTGGGTAAKADPQAEAAVSHYREGSQAAFEAVEPMLEKSDPVLIKTIDEQFAAVEKSLDPYRRGEGFVSYTELTSADTRKLAQKIDTLAEELSQVPVQIVG